MKLNKSDQKKLMDGYLKSMREIELYMLNRFEPLVETIKESESKIEFDWYEFGENAAFYFAKICHDKFIGQKQILNEAKIILDL